MSRNALPAPPPELMHPTEVAEALRVSRPQVYKYVHLGELVAVPLPGGARAGIRITRASLDALLERQRAEGARRFGPVA